MNELLDKISDFFKQIPRLAASDWFGLDYLKFDFANFPRQLVYRSPHFAAHRFNCEPHRSAVDTAVVLIHYAHQKFNFCQKLNFSS